MINAIILVVFYGFIAYKSIFTDSNDIFDAAFIVSTIVINVASVIRDQIIKEIRKANR